MFHYLSDPGTEGVGVAFTSSSMNLSDQQGPALRNQALGRLAARLGVPVVVVQQVHGNRVIEVSDAAAEAGVVDLATESADGLVTGVRGVALAVRVADCVPVLFADAAAGVIGAAHAGRAGLLNGVLAATVEALRVRGASCLQAWVGPHICAACYEVPDAMARDFERRTGVVGAVTRWGTPGIDLGGAVAAQLAALDVPFESVEDCTFTSDDLDSFRRDGAESGRTAGLIWMQ